MNKSILVINTPKCCGKCKMRRYDGNDTFRCFATNRILDDIENIASDCPLKPLPKELEPGISDEYVNYCQGFNDCINEILGEENE